MFHPDLGWVTMHVTEKTFFAAVLHLDWSTGTQRKQTAVHLQTDVFACSESPTDTTKYQTNIVLWQFEACSNLATVFVQPLCCNVQLDTIATRIGESHCCFETQEGLVLHTDRVVALNRDVARDMWISTNNFLVADEIAVGMNLFCGCKHCQFWIYNWCEYFVIDDDCSESPPTCLWMIRCNRGDRFAHIANKLGSKNWLVCRN